MLVIAVWISICLVDLFQDLLVLDLLVSEIGIYSSGFN